METIVSLSAFFTPAGVVILVTLLAADLRNVPLPRAPEIRLASTRPRPIPMVTDRPPIVAETRAILDELLEIIGSAGDDPRITALESRIKGLGAPETSPPPRSTSEEGTEAETGDAPVDGERLAGANLFSD